LATPTRARARVTSRPRWKRTNAQVPRSTLRAKAWTHAGRRRPGRIHPTPRDASPRTRRRRGK
jgi:hypothetical protein